MKNPYKEKIVKTIRQLGYVYSTWNVFNDFVEMSALTIANSVEHVTEIRDKREERYLEAIRKYRPEEQNLFPEMFADLVNALQYELTWSNAPVDVLGVIFHELELHDQYKGQFFTPQSICDAMGVIAFGDSQKRLQEKGYITLNEPCCGSGAMCLGFAKAMLDAGFNYCAQLAVLATDIDLKCVHMCYLQLSLYGIPAIVVHGNSLTLEEWSRWFTPVMYLRMTGAKKSEYMSVFDKYSA
jgi:type I restriction-modification system DNA methylase subunit